MNPAQDLSKKPSLAEMVLSIISFTVTWLFLLRNNTKRTTLYSGAIKYTGTSLRTFWELVEKKYVFKEVLSYSMHPANSNVEETKECTMNHSESDWAEIMYLMNQNGTTKAIYIHPSNPEVCLKEETSETDMWWLYYITWSLLIFIGLLLVILWVALIGEVFLAIRQMRRQAATGDDDDDDDNNDVQSTAVVSTHSARTAVHRMGSTGRV